MKPFSFIPDVTGQLPQKRDYVIEREKNSQNDKENPKKDKYATYAIAQIHVHFPIRLRRVFHLIRLKYLFRYSKTREKVTQK